MERGRRSFPTAAGWFFTRPGTRTNGGSRRHDSLTLALVLRSRARRALRALLRMRRPTHTEFAARCRTVAVSSHLTMSNSPHFFVPAAQFAPGVCNFASLTPKPRGGRSAEKRSGACEAPVGRIMTRYARRLRGALRPMTRDARLSALHRGDFSPGAALLSPLPSSR
jgi:hypothetical protein